MVVPRYFHYTINKRDNQYLFKLVLNLRAATVTCYRLASLFLYNPSSLVKSARPSSKIANSTYAQ